MEDLINEKDPQHDEYVEWFDKSYGVKPNDGWFGIKNVDEYVSLRDEMTGNMGDTELIDMLKEKGTYETELQRILDTYSVLTFDEYIEMKKDAA